MTEKFRENGQLLITLGLIIAAITIIVALFFGKENNFPYFFFAILISAILILLGILLYVLEFIFNKRKK